MTPPLGVTARALPRWQRPEALPDGLDAWVQRWQGRWARRASQARRLHAQAQACAQQAQSWGEADDATLAQGLAQARAQLRRDPQQAKGELLQALAVVAALAARALGMQAYPVQLMGALALHQGALAEMATGEGKTLTVALAAVLAALSGRACHVVTANDYLAQRDAEAMAPLFQRCGLSVSSVHAAVPVATRAQAHDADVVYVTPKDLLADHLRDQVAAQGAKPMATALVRGLHTAIVDEADSVFIDEAVTPLILAMPRQARGLDEAVQRMAAWAAELQVGQDYRLDPKQRRVELGAEALARVQRWAPELPPAWRALPKAETLLRQALQVRHFFKRGEQFLLQDGEVVLLDEQTGRMTPGRSLTGGLHQAIEAAHGLAITAPNEASSQMSFQAFFRGFARLSGCSGTAWEAADELWRVFGLRVVRVPTHRPRQVRVAPPRWCASEAEKWQAVAREAQDLQAQGRAVLVGVRSVDASEALRECMVARGLEVVVLNATSHDQEAALVAAAGEAGRITIATNMAGRGTDIRLSEAVRRRGGLHVVIAQPNDSSRIDRQLAGRCGRQGDPGSVSMWWCPQDASAQRAMSRGSRPLWLAAARLPGLRGRALAWALHRGQRRHEALASAQREAVLKADAWMAQALPFAQGDVA
jgi:preprotein translocase subunit SecA